MPQFRAPSKKALYRVGLENLHHPLRSLNCLKDVTGENMKESEDRKKTTLLL